MSQRPPCPLPAAADQVRVPSGESKGDIGFNREEARGRGQAVSIPKYVFRL